MYDQSFRDKNCVSADSLANLQIASDTTGLPINRPFTPAELEFALAKGKGKSAGPDDHGYPSLKHLPPIGKRTFLHLINKAWLNETVPEEWNHSLVVPIPKNEGSSADPSSFRPIALTCCSSKIMERMVNRRLSHFLEEHNHLDHRQHAFRPGHGTGTYFATLGQVLRDAKENNLHVEIAALDLAKAYNRTWGPNVVRQLQEWGLTGHILAFVRNFLHNRTFQVCIGAHRSKICQEETGVPQGSVIAVTLFLVAMNSVFRSLPKEIFIFVYADDIILVVVRKTLKALRRKLQAAVKAVGTWADTVGFQLSVKKSSISHVCNSNHRVTPSSIAIHGEIIPCRKTIRILGIRIDRHLTFKDHFLEVKKSCRTRINLLKTLSKDHRSNNRDVRLRVAKAIINSRLTYGLELTCSADDQLVKILGPIYNTSLRTIAGLLPSTPALATCAEVGELPFGYFVTATTCKRAIGFLAHTEPSTEEVFLLDEANRLLERISNQRLPPVAWVHWNGARCWAAPRIRIDETIKNGFKAGDSSPALKKAVVELLSTRFVNHTVRYTDGSKAQGRVGIAMTEETTSQQHRLPDTCSVFSAEAAAIFLAASTLSANPVAILTDSASVISALSNPNTKHPWIQAIQKCARNVTFMWIPGHCGIPGNETADFLAASGVYCPLLTSEVPGQDVKQWIDKIIGNAWAIDWSRRRSPFLREVKGDTRRWDDLPLLRDQRVLSRLRTGHTRFSHNMGDGSSFRRQCDTCRTHRSVEHFLIDCPLYEQVRTAYGIQGSVKEVLQEDGSSSAALICFLKDTQLYDEI